MTVGMPARQMQETFHQCCPTYRKGTNSSCIIWISLSHVLVVRGLISHDEGRAGLANLCLTICESVRSRCIQFSDCIEDYAKAGLMHLSCPVANLTRLSNAPAFPAASAEYTGRHPQKRNARFLNLALS